MGGGGVKGKKSWIDTHPWHTQTFFKSCLRRNMGRRTKADVNRLSILSKNKILLSSFFTLNKESFVTLNI